MAKEVQERVVTPHGHPVVHVTLVPEEDSARRDALGLNLPPALIDEPDRREADADVGFPTGEEPDEIPCPRLVRRRFLRGPAAQGTRHARPEGRVAREGD